MKIALGMMIRNFISPEPVVTFLENARKYEHEISKVIVASFGKIEESAAREIEKTTGVSVTTVKINQATYVQKAFAEMGVSEKTSRKLLFCDVVNHAGLVPYGYNRNNVLIQAVLEEADILFYIDDDVAPYVLKKKSPEGKRIGEDNIVKEEIDLFGRHLQEIEKGARFTTSDYSGFNILPYAYFDGMDELLIGLQKENMLEFWERSREHQCMFLQHPYEPIPKRTNKILGGNLAIDIRDRKKILPFFSPVYEVSGTTYLARGEDTLIASLAEEAKLNCVDIDMYIFHNTYGDYPEVPSLKNKKSTQERFFYACTGWIGRNPFMNYLHDNATDRVRWIQYDNLVMGTHKLIKYTGNEMFSILPEAHRSAWDSLPMMIEDHKETMDAWGEFLSKI